MVYQVTNSSAYWAWSITTRRRWLCSEIVSIILWCAFSSLKSHRLGLFSTRCPSQRTDRLKYHLGWVAIWAWRMTKSAISPMLHWGVPFAALSPATIRCRGTVLSLSLVVALIPSRTSRLRWISRLISLVTLIWVSMILHCRFRMWRKHSCVPTSTALRASLRRPFPQWRHVLILRITQPR